MAHYLLLLSYRLSAPLELRRSDQIVDFLMPPRTLLPMPSYKRKDHYYQKAKQEGLPSRSAYKIEEIQRKFHLIRLGDHIVDLGCSPGGWLLQMADYTGPNGLVLGVDLEEPTISIQPPIQFIKGDFTLDSTVDKIMAHIEQADVIVSDMAPHTSGVKFVDSLKSQQLAELALDLSRHLLKKGGNFTAKIFPGADFTEYTAAMKQMFEKVIQFIPDSTRKSSREIYMVGLSFIK